MRTSLSTRSPAWSSSVRSRNRPSAAPAVGLGRGRLGDRDELADATLEDRLDERLARREMPVERADPETGAARDLLERGVDSLLGEHLARRRDEQLVVPLRVRDADPAARPRSRSSRTTIATNRRLTLRLLLPSHDARARPLVLDASPQRRRCSGSSSSIGVGAAWQGLGSHYSSNFTLGHTGAQRAADLLKSRFPAQAGDVDQIVFRTRTGQADRRAGMRSVVAPMLAGRRAAAARDRRDQPVRRARRPTRSRRTARSALRAFSSTSAPTCCRPRRSRR